MLLCTKKRMEMEILVKTMQKLIELERLNLKTFVTLFTEIVRSNIYSINFFFFIKIFFFIHGVFFFLDSFALGSFMVFLCVKDCAVICIFV